jgi:Holliday junction resolvase
MEKSIRREANVERSFCDRLKRSGCLVYKFISPGNNGVPDRIVITPQGRVIFVELKTKIGKLRGDQVCQIRKLVRHGQYVRVLHGADEVDRFVREVTS